MTEIVRVEKLVHGGQGIATLPDGRKVFVWNALPGEEVEVEVKKDKRSYAEGFASKIVKPSKDRIDELGSEDINLSVQPWSIMSYPAEQEAKRAITSETFEREGIALPGFEVQSLGGLSAYRNKVEFSFWGDEDGLFYSHFLRASHRKIKLQYPYHDLIKNQISDYAEKLIKELNNLKIRAGDLKSVIIRCDNNLPAESLVVGSLFVKTTSFPKLKTKNLVVYYSNPKSPASLPTKKLYQNGSTTLTDTLLGVKLCYDVISFFQVNLPIFELALKRINNLSGEAKKVDLYSGVGSIGIPIAGTETMVELDKSNIKMAEVNAAGLSIDVENTSSEKALGYIKKDKCIIVDPPRAGLHKDLIAKLIEVKPQKLIYISCNPSTQARDIKLLIDGGYKLETFDAYNFFPRTPHIETLVSLKV